LETETTCKEIEWDIERNVPRKPRLLDGVKGHGVKENTLPGSRALCLPAVGRGGELQMISDIRDTITHWLVDRYKVVDELEFYP